MAFQLSESVRDSLVEMKHRGGRLSGPQRLSAERWLMQFRSACRAAEGGVVRRRIADVEAVVGLDRFLSEVTRNGWQLFRNGRHFVILCNDEPLVRVTAETVKVGERLSSQPFSVSRKPFRA